MFRILRDLHDIEDAAQNASLQVIYHFDKISEISCKKLGFWIISIVKNEALVRRLSMLSYLLAALESEEDKRRFTELYEENHMRVEQTALRILRDPHDAEDAVQNAFLQVIHHFDEISEIPCKKLGFWIISIVKNEALMILRRKQKELPQEDWDTFSADVSDPTSYNELVQLFSQLPPTYRAALEMRLINGYSGKEIAQHLGISESAVNTRISRGRALLREIAVKEGFHI